MQGSVWNKSNINLEKHSFKTILCEGLSSDILTELFGKSKGLFVNTSCNIYSWQLV